MGLSPLLQGVKLLALDTVSLIYAFERHPVHFAQVASVFAAIDAGDLVGVASTLALLETLVGPLQRGNTALADTYRRALVFAPHLRLIPVDEAVAERAAGIRAQHRLKAPDAIHLATAIQAGADAFLTNDTQLRAFAGMRVVTVAEL